MAEDDGKGSGRSRFKSKWGKILKHSEDIKSTVGRKGKDPNSQEDVDDFLKPSVEKAAANRPRLDVSIAQRWPDPNAARQGAYPPDGAQNVNGWRKRRRREGLAVGFVKTVPEIIGHGGDETLSPPSEVAQQRLRTRAPGPEHRPIGQGDAYQRAGPITVDTSMQQGATHPSQGPPMPQQQQNQYIRPGNEESLPPPRIGISRAATGFSSQEEDWSPISDYDDAPPSLPTLPQTMDSRIAEQPQDSGSGGQLKISPTPRNPHTLVARRQNDMRANEGMALRRASAMIEPPKGEDGDELDFASYAAATAAYRAEVAATPPTSAMEREAVAPSLDIPPPQPALSLDFASYPAATAASRAEVVDSLPTIAVEREPVLPSVDIPSPQSAASLDSPSPFADTKYIKRHSRDVFLTESPAQVQQTHPPPPPPGGRSPFADPKYIHARSRSKDVSPARPPRRDENDQANNLPVHEPSPQYLDPQRSVGPPSVTPPADQTKMVRQQNADLSFVVPRGPRQAPDSRALETSIQRPTKTSEPPSYMRAAQPAYAENAVPSSTLPMSAPRIVHESQNTQDSRDRSPMRDRLFDSQTSLQQPTALLSRPNGSSTSVNMFAPSSGVHSRNNSYDQKSFHTAPGTPDNLRPSPMPHTASSGATSSSSPPTISSQHQNYLAARPMNTRQNDSTSSQLGPPKPSPYARGPSPNGYFDVDRQQPIQPARSPMPSLQTNDASRPGSAHSNQSHMPPAPPSHTPSAANTAAESAFDDFASRVSHMKGVFKLTAEKEQPGDVTTPSMWLRAAFWWYLRGKTGLETLLHQRSKSRDVEHRELLAQPHVDLAKTVWMLADPLEGYTPASHNYGPSELEATLRRDIQILRDHLKSLSHLMLRSNIMPPPQSLIQGQDTQIWLEYPRFTPEVAASLSGAGNRRSLIVDSSQVGMCPSEALPLGGSQEYHYYHRSTVNVSLNTDDVDTDRVSVPCTLSVIRGQRDYQCTVVIASQSNLVNVKIAPRQSSNNTGLTWQDVSWKASSLAISVSLPRGIDLTIRFFENDFRSLWNIVEYSRRVDHGQRSERNEVPVHEAQLLEVQYADSSDPKAFPQDKVKRCRALIWERFEEFQHGGPMRKRHRGFRLVVVTDPGHKNLSIFNHEICANGPLFYEFITDAAAHGTTAMVIRIREEQRQCRMLLVFNDMDSRQALYNKLNGIDVKREETIVGKMALTSLSIESTSNAISGSSSGHSELAVFQWQRLGITNHGTDDMTGRPPSTVESESLRIVARHNQGCITDRLNLDKGELLLRLPCTETPTIQLLRQPQDDLTMSIDTRGTPHNVSDGVADVYKVARNLSTIRTFTFATHNDLHAFQAVTTGFTVRYDALASTLAISRRRMVVPIYHKWAASNVRIQIVANPQNTVIQLLAFMEDFTHAEALCIQVKTTDVFESIKGDGKNKKWAIKMVDAKFSLPPAISSKDEELPIEEKAKRRFISLEGLDYAQEHDDITVGFDTQEARDNFANALPAPATAGRMITLKRRI